MPHETFAGPDVSTLLAQAGAAIGSDAVVIAVRRMRGPREGFELEAADPATAALLKRHAPAPLVRTAAGPVREAAGCGPLVLALVGPTGAGKTTTIAKLANHPEAFGQRAVGLLCLDTYRIGAIEQLSIYAELSRLPIEVAFGERELARALQRLAACDVILADTAGRGPRSERDRAATQTQLLQLSPGEVHLALPAGLDPGRARRVVAQYRSCGVTHLLPTKLDEFPGDTTAFDLAAEFGLPVRWFTDGQEVPSDLGRAAAGCNPPAPARAPCALVAAEA